MTKQRFYFAVLYSITVLLIADRVMAQSYPSWYANPTEVADPQVIHPAFPAIPLQRGLHRLNNLHQCIGRTLDWIVVAHGLHGEVLCFWGDPATGTSTLVGTLGGSDFDHVLHVSAVRGYDNEFLACGLKNGVPVIKVGRYDLSGSSPAVSWKATLLTGLTSGIPITAFLDECRLFVFDVASNSVCRYDDSDGDLLPDLAGSWGSVDCSPIGLSPREICKSDVFGFELVVRDQRILADRWRLETAGGSQSLVAFRPWAGGDLRPALVVDDLSVGQRALAFRYGRGLHARVKVVRSGSEFDVTGSKETDPQTGLCTVLISQALQLGDVVKVEDAQDPAIVSREYQVASPLRPILVVHPARRVRPGEALALIGEQLSGPNVSYVVRLDGVDVTGSLSISPVKQRKVVIEVPAPSEGRVFSIMEVEVYDPSISPMHSSVRVIVQPETPSVP
ncbi:MAG: hypothetical protein H6807_07080 [Planctomycetes bacterium]|nr:hypothetical protein [Planctomycetota bacterium]